MCNYVSFLGAVYNQVRLDSDYESLLKWAHSGGIFALFTISAQ